jgi:hypothetical protein
LERRNQPLIQPQHSYWKEHFGDRGRMSQVFLQSLAAMSDLPHAEERRMMLGIKQRTEGCLGRLTLSVNPGCLGT